MTSTPTKRQSQTEDTKNKEETLLLIHAKERAFVRNELMLLPHSSEALQSFFENSCSVLWNGNSKGIFGEGEERKISDICYSFIGFSDFM
jgi:hypothetical protein